jgi:hypothetical protein
VRLDREPGEGVVLYFGERPGRRFVGMGLGFSGWEMNARGCWRFMHPYIHFGRLFSDAPARRFSFRLRLPAWLWHRIEDRRHRKEHVDAR